MYRRSLLICLMSAALIAGLPLSAHASEPSIPLWSESLSRQLDPPRIPFVAHYRKGALSLDFVAVNHVFTLQNTTIDAIGRSFERLQPAAVVLEGFPTAMGVSPEPIKVSVGQRLFPDADPYAKGEGTYAAGLAMECGIPFIGGEPTEKETLQHLLATGYSKNELTLFFLSRELSQALRAGTWVLGDESGFAAVFERVLAVFANTFDDDLMNVSQYRGWYRAYFYADPVSDPGLTKQLAPDSTTRMGQLMADSMRYRDQHIATVIAQQLAFHRRVLVVYGHSHWTTQAAVLAARYGEPRFDE